MHVNRQTFIKVNTLDSLNTDVFDPVAAVERMFNDVEIVSKVLFMLVASSKICFASFFLSPQSMSVSPGFFATFTCVGFSDPAKSTIFKSPKCPPENMRRVVIK